MTTGMSRSVLRWYAAYPSSPDAICGHSSAFSAEVAVRATDPLTGTTLKRRFPAPATEEGRERTLSLAVSQLMLSSFVENVVTARADVRAGKVPAARCTAFRC